MRFPEGYVKYKSTSILRTLRNIDRDTIFFFLEKNNTCRKNMKTKGSFRILNATMNIFGTKINKPPRFSVVRSLDNSRQMAKSPLKILALHGGGQTVSSFQSMKGIQDLMEELVEYEFVFAKSPEEGNVWIQDSPNGKNVPTTDPNWAQQSIVLLDKIVKEQGPFHAILGFSQGAAIIPVYLAKTKNIFEKVMLYCGYLPITHDGLIRTIELAEPLTESAMIFSGKNDFGFREFAPSLAAKFFDPLEVQSVTAGHHLPSKKDSTFDSIIDFIRQ